MKTTFLTFAIALIIQLSLVPTASAQHETTTGAIATMYALDPITASLSLRDGKPGGVFQDHIAKNRDSQITFHIYAKDSFRVGIQGGDNGVILDIGSDAELRSRYGFADTVGNGQAFTSIHIEQGRGLISKHSESGQFQTLKGVDELGPAREGADVVQVVLGHIYLVRIDSKGKAPLYAKLKVVAFVPGESVTIRWVLL